MFLNEDIKKREYIKKKTKHNWYNKLL
jgi:hypothetical protein